MARALARILGAFAMSLLLILRPPGWADDLDHATLEGFVLDPTEAAIAGATLALIGPQTGLRRTTTSDARGWYRLTTLAPGTYVLRAEAPGFAPLEHRALLLKAGQTRRLDVRLRPGPLIEAVTVTEAETETMDPARTVVGLSLPSEEIERLPLNGRNPLDLVFLLASVQAEPFETRDLGDPATRDVVAEPPQEAGLFSLSGGRAYSNNITIDGFDNNDDRTARERAIPSLESVAEVQVITNQFSAEYGRASGGRINLFTRRGGNQFRGAIFGDFQDESLNANSFFRNARGQKRAPFQRREYGGRLGGPIRRDRFFFFGVIERQEEPDTDALIAVLPVDPRANPAYPLQETPTGRPFVRDGVTVALFEDELSTFGHRTYMSGRLDAVLAHGHQLVFRFDLTRTNRLRARDQGATLREGLINRRRNSMAYAVQESWTIGSRLLAQLRFQYSALTPTATPRAARPGVIVGSSRGTTLSVASGFIAGAAGFPETRAERRFQWAGALTGQWGRHTLKLGADVMHLRSATRQLHLFFGFYNFPSFGDFVASAPSRYRQRIGEPEHPVHNTIFGGFLQDEWRMRPNLTLAFGLRYDRETLLDRDKNNLGPRLALAWAPGRRAHTVFRGGAGVFYNRVLLRTIEDFAGHLRLFEIDLGSGPGATGRIEELNRIGGFPNIFPNDPTHPLVRDLIRPIRATRSLAPDLRIPQSLQSSVGIERRFGRALALEVSYVFNRTLRLWRDRNVNAPIPPPGGLVAFLLEPPEGFPGVVRAPDGRTAFDNSARQIADVSARFVRFDLSATRSRDVGSGANRMRIYGLNAPGGGATTTDPALAALNAVRFLRPDPERGEVEQLQSDGQATYHGLNVIVSARVTRGLQFRASYTFSKLIDLVDVNTSSPQDEFNFALERGLGRTDERHRVVLSGTLRAPALLGGLEVTPLVTLSSGRPFNITTNGQDRNLSDTLTDRPHFLGRGPIRFVPPGDTARSEAMAAQFLFPTIGTNGTLGRNVGRGPGTRRVDLRLAREFRVSERLRLRPWVNAYNLLNTPNFLMTGFYGPLDEREGRSVFLQPRATRRPRTLELGLRLEF